MLVITRGYIIYKSGIYECHIKLPMRKESKDLAFRNKTTWWVISMNVYISRPTWSDWPSWHFFRVWVNDELGLPLFNIMFYSSEISVGIWRDRAEALDANDVITQTPLEKIKLDQACIEYHLVFWLQKTNQYKSCKQKPKISSLPVQHLDEMGRDQLMRLGSRWYTHYQIDRHYPLVNVYITIIWKITIF